MRQLRLTDIELQRLIAPALKTRLRKEGFEFGAPEGYASAHPDEMPEPMNGLLMLPINLDLAGFVNVDRDPDGIWTFTQQSPKQAQRFGEAFADHVGAIEGQRRSKL